MKDCREFYLVNHRCGRQFEGYKKGDILVCRETNPVLGYPRKNGKILRIDFSDCKVLKSYIGARSFWTDTKETIKDIEICNTEK